MRRYRGAALPGHAALSAENRALKAGLARVREQRDILEKRWACSPNRRGALPTHRSHENRPFRGSTLHGPGGEPSRSLRLAGGWPERPGGGRHRATRRHSGRACRVSGPLWRSRITRELRRRGQRHGPKRIARLLREAGLRGRCARRYVPCTTDRRHDQPIAPTGWPRRLRPPRPTRSGWAI